MTVEEQKKFARTHADLTYHTIEARCRVCGKPLTVEIADIYPELGDPLKAVPMATCNRCADLRNRRIETEERLRRICHHILNQPKSKRTEVATRYAKPIEDRVRDWIKVANQTNGSAVEFDEAMVESILKDPVKYGEVLGRISGLAKKPRPAPQPSLPYKDA